MFTRTLTIALLAAALVLAGGMAHADSFMAVRHYPPHESARTTDMVLTAPLQQQNFKDLRVYHDYNQVKVMGNHDYELVTLVYDSATGKLIGASERTDWKELADNS